jgi:hypothetical protein
MDELKRIELAAMDTFDKKDAGIAGGYKRIERPLAAPAIAGFNAIGKGGSFD